MNWNEDTRNNMLWVLCLFFLGTVITVLTACALYALIDVYVGTPSSVTAVIYGVLGALVGYGLMILFARRIAQLERQEFDEQFSSQVARKRA